MCFAVGGRESNEGMSRAFGAREMNAAESVAVAVLYKGTCVVR